LVRCCVPSRDRIPLPYAASAHAYQPVGDVYAVNDVLEGHLPDDVYPYDYTPVGGVEGGVNSVNNPTMTHSRVGNDRREAGPLPGNYVQARVFDGLQPDPPPQYEESHPPPLFEGYTPTPTHANNNHHNIQQVHHHSNHHHSSHHHSNAATQPLLSSHQQQQQQQHIQMPASAEAIALSSVSVVHHAARDDGGMNTGSGTGTPIMSGGMSRRGSGSNSPLVPRSPHRRSGLATTGSHKSSLGREMNRRSSGDLDEEVGGAPVPPSDDVDWNELPGRSRAIATGAGERMGGDHDEGDVDMRHATEPGSTDEGY